MDSDNPTPPLDPDDPRIPPHLRARMKPEPAEAKSAAESLVEMSARMLAGLATISELAGNLHATVDGYRAQCVARGYSDHAAELMAVEFHRVLLAVVFKGTLR
jgi:hypothetical protein